MRQTRRVGELWFALALFVFALAALWQAYGIAGFTSLSSAGVFPMLAAGTMAVSSLLVVVGTARRPAAEDTRPARFLAEALPGRLLIFLALIAGFLAAMPFLGFWLASAVFLYAAIALLWRRGVVRPLLITILALALVYLTFRVGFEIVLPRGTLLPRFL